MQTKGKENLKQFVSIQEHYTNFIDLENHATALSDAEKFDQAIELVSNHRNQFFAVAYILLGELYRDKAKQSLPNINPGDLKASILHFLVGRLYAEKTYILVTEHRWDHSCQDAIEDLCTSCGIKEIRKQTLQALHEQAKNIFINNPVPEQWHEQQCVMRSACK